MSPLWTSIVIWWGHQVQAGAKDEQRPGSFLGTRGPTKNYSRQLVAAIFCQDAKCGVGEKSHRGPWFLVDFSKDRFLRHWEGGLRMLSQTQNILKHFPPKGKGNRRLVLTNRHPSSTWPATARQAAWPDSERSCRQLALLRSSASVTTHWSELSHYRSWMSLSWCPLQSPRTSSVRWMWEL